MIDVSKIQPGDKFTAEFTARAPHGVLSSSLGPCILEYGNETHILFEGLAVTVDKIVGHTPKPREIAVGDNIVYTAVGETDTIVRIVVAIFEGQVAYKYVVGSKTYYASAPRERVRHRQ